MNTNTINNQPAPVAVAPATPANDALVFLRMEELAEMLNDYEFSQHGAAALGSKKWGVRSTPWSASDSLHFDASVVLSWRGGGDPPLHGIEIVVTPVDGGPSVKTVTTRSGQAWFRELPIGKYAITACRTSGEHDPTQADMSGLVTTLRECFLHLGFTYMIEHARWRVSVTTLHEDGAEFGTAQVRIESMQKNLEWGTVLLRASNGEVARTDAKGFAELGLLEPGKRCTLDLAPENYS